MTQVDQGPQDWSGRTVRDRDGAKLGKLTEVFPAGPGGGHGTWGVVRSPLGRRRMVPLDGAAPDDDRGLQVPVDRSSVRSAPGSASGAPDPETETTLHHHYTGRGALAAAQSRQRERFGGIKVGAAFFGWLVAVGMTVLLAGLAGGIAAGIGTSSQLTPGPAGAAPVGIIGAVVALVVLLLAYYAGGYVAGRLARFDGARNGFLSWLIGVLVTIAAVVVAAVAGNQYNVFAQVQLPAGPVGPEQLTVAGILTLAVVVLGTLIAAVLGGKAGERFHRRVDQAGTDAI